MTERVKPVEKVYGVYIGSMLTMKVPLSITEVGKNVKQNLERIISKKTEGKCIAEGFIRPNSIKVISYSAGIINSEIIEFQTVFECMICNPVEGMKIECITKTITKAGIHAEVMDQKGIVPVTVFVARDHHISDKTFNSIKENTKITVRVIGSRFELNDPFIYVIGELMNDQFKTQTIRKPRLVIGGDEDSFDEEDGEANE
jgi:hypothetical protein